MCLITIFLSLRKGVLFCRKTPVSSEKVKERKHGVFPSLRSTLISSLTPVLRTAAAFHRKGTSYSSGTKYRDGLLLRKKRETCYFRYRRYPLKTYERASLRLKGNKGIYYIFASIGSPFLWREGTTSSLP